MNALVLTLFVSALLFVYGLVQFAVAWARRDHQHADRLALLPLDDDVAPVTASFTTKDNRHAR
ncbi:MAG TPA: cytochrome oxidase [Myxococcota bacterium]